MVIADDHPLMRKGIRQTFESAPEMKILAEAGDGKSALDLVARFRPKVAVLDISMPVMDGFDVVRAIQKYSLPVEVVFLTAQSDEALFDGAVELGVKGYVLKECAASDIVACVRTVVAGQHYISPALATHLIRGRQKEANPRAAALCDLSAAELRVIRMVMQYKTTREIAEELHVSPLTVETHRRNMCEKLGLRGSNALVKFALAHRDEIE
jgi:DNA-binding NarL/FixJ family response regulator